MVTFYCYFYSYYLVSFGKKSFFLVAVGTMDSYSQVSVTVSPFLVVSDCNIRDCSTPGSSVLHYLQEFAQIRVHSVSDAI